MDLGERESAWKPETNPSHPMSESAKYIQFMDALDAAMTRLEEKSDTPETDEFASMRRTAQEWTDHAQKLERERDEARAMARDMRNQIERDSRARLIFPWENVQGDGSPDTNTQPTR